jgi:threonine/homoserine/homoserine lactone efflux protein
MNLIELFIIVFIISISGVFSPGPLTFAALAIGIKTNWKGGILMSIGHLIVEFPLALAIAFGITFITSSISNLLSIFGGIFMIIFGFLIIKSAKNYEIKSFSHSPLILGISLSILNPYFILWWITIGSSLINLAIELAGLFGVIFMYISHIWIDFLWLIILAILGYQGRKLGKYYPYFVMMLGFILIIFGINFIIKIF